MVAGLKGDIQAPSGPKKHCAPRCRQFRKQAEPAQAAEAAEARAAEETEIESICKYSEPRAAQMWLKRRLAGLHQDLTNVAVYVTSALSPPPGFHKIRWVRCADMFRNESSNLSEQDKAALQNLQCILIISNPFIPTEFAMLMKLVQVIDRQFGHEVAPLIWMPHTVAPEVRPSHMPLQISKKSTKYAMECGIDGIIAGEPEGGRLRRAFMARLLHSKSLDSKLTNMMAENISKLQYEAYLKNCIEFSMWDYARARVAEVIPPVDPNIAPGIPMEIPGFLVGEQLGNGRFGGVFKLHPKGENLIRLEEGCPKVVKMIAKEDLTDVSDLKHLKRSIEVMNLLSSKEKKHINIVELFQVHHSKSHVLLVMEDGGPENLFRRLLYRVHPDPNRRRPLTLPMIESLVCQALLAIHHLHMGVGMSHRDIKPENFVIRHTEDDLVIKLADFDSAVIHQNGMQCRALCGTMPFMAPEVVFEKKYDGRKYDIWSFGIVLLEVLCGVRIMERAFSVETDNTAMRQPVFSDETKSLMLKMRSHFAEPGAAGFLLQHFHLREVRPICALMLPALNGMLTVNPEQRWNADQVVEHLMVSDPEPESDHIH